MEGIIMYAGKQSFNILDYGAREDVLSTAQIQAAFDAAAESGSGTVVIPAGIYLTGTINLKGASLYLEKGAVLKGSPDINDYPFYGFVHNEMGNVFSLLYSMDTSGISISGEGTIDLNGDSFYNMAGHVVPPGRAAFTEAQIEECTVRIGKRPNQPILFRRVNHLTVKGIRIVNAPCWTMSFIECRDIKVSDLTIDNSLCIPNNDGMHFVSCTDVMVRNCNISAGDDCIAMTCITDWYKPTERVVISDCILRSCSKAVSIGYMHSIVRDVVISNCIIYESNRAMVFMASAGTGLIENVTVSNLRLDTRIRAGNWWGNGEPVCIMGTWHNYERYRDPPPEKRFPVSIRNILFQNLICSGENVIAVIGENGSVRNIKFDHLLFELKDSENLPLKGRTVDLSPGEQKAELPDNGIPYWLFVKDAEVDTRNCTVQPFHGQTPRSYVL
jgi:polygalacturonase